MQAKSSSVGKRYRYAGSSSSVDSDRTQQEDERAYWAARKVCYL